MMRYLIIKDRIWDGKNVRIVAMSPGRERIVTKQLSCRELNGPFTETFSAGERLVLLRFGGDDCECAVFARLRDVQLSTAEHPNPSPQYEAEREQFEASTESVET